MPPPDDREIRLRLASVLRGIPPSLLSAEAPSVPEDLEFALPFRLVESQLSSGRVVIPRHVFIRALPESHRDILGTGEEPSDIPLPLEEVFRRLPSNALTLRPDQVVQETGEAFPTPFKQKADEDALRFGTPPPEPAPELATPPAPAEEPSALPIAAPIALESGLGLDEAARETVLIPPLEEIIRDRAPAPEEPVAEAVAVEEQSAVENPVALPPLELPPEPVAAVAEPEAPAPAPAPEPEPIRISLSEFAPHVESDAALQAILMSDEDMDAKTVVRLVSKLPGISGCTIMFGDGFRLAGNFPDEAQAEGFSAMAPVFYKRAANFAEEVRFGDLQTLTLYTAEGLLSFFMDADICLSVKHSGRGFLPGVREKLQGVTREMAIKYAAAHQAPIPH